MKTEKIYFGFKSIKNLETFLSRRRARRIFLVTGNRSYGLSGAKRILKEMLKSYDVFHFHDFSVNPKLEEVKRGVVLFRKKKYDMVIAVGGGSAIDMAKLINILAFQKGPALGYIKKRRHISQKGKPLVAIPTTAGSGSEATHFAVVSVDKVKHSAAHEYLLPDMAIVDPQFTMRLPSCITASTGMDVLCQAIESYWSINSCAESKWYAKKAIKLVMRNLVKSVRNPTRDSRLNMAKAALLAGKAIRITKTTAPHAVSYPITSYFGVPHGHAVSLTMPAFLVYNYEVGGKENLDKRGVLYVKRMIEEISRLIGCDSPYEARYKILRLMKEIGLTETLAGSGIKKRADIQKIAAGFDIERAANNPRMITRKNLKRLIKTQCLQKR